MNMQKIPLIILGGSDKKPSELPDRGKDQRPLSGFKAIDFKPAEGQSLVDVVLERARASDAFYPIYIAGPAEIYGSVVDSQCMIDTNGSFGENLRNSLETVVSQHPESSVAFLTCDVVADVEGLRRLMSDYWKSTPCDLWFPVVRVPPETRRLEASDWKPRYRIVPQPGAEAVEVLPGHLLIVDPSAIRLGLAYELFDVAYATRNRPVNHRRNMIVRKIAWMLLYHDVLHILSFRVPRLTFNILRAAISTARELRTGTITQKTLEDNLQLVGVKNAHRKKYPERRFIMPIIDELSLALDIDTEEEARALEGRLGQ